MVIFLSQLVYMGRRLFDQYSLLHFAVGVLAYFWGINFATFLLFHIAFEILENSANGKYFINKYVTIWPGGKPESDSLLNILSDNIFGTVGWTSAYCLDHFVTNVD